MYEIEIVRRSPLETDADVTCEICGENKAGQIVEIGQVGDSSGIDYALCTNPICKHAAMENAQDALYDVNLHRPEIQGQDHYDSREGK